MREIPLDARIYVAGHRGLVGSALVRRLRREGFTRLLTATRAELDLRRPADVERWFARERPEYVLVAAGTVGGIQANASRPAEFLHDNLAIHSSVLHAAFLHPVERLLYFGSSCIYPRECPQPIREESLLTGPLEPTNAPYAVAKIAGVTLCRAYREQYGCDFVAVMPTNLYGPNDDFDPESAHVLPALMHRLHRARRSGRRRVAVWGTGTPRRELMHVDDLADASLFLMRHYEGASHVNVGTGEDLSIRELAERVRDCVAPEVELAFDATKPDGAPRKLLDVSLLRGLGWRARIGLTEGIASTYAWYLAHEGSSRRRVATASAARGGVLQGAA